MSKKSPHQQAVAGLRQLQDQFGVNFADLARSKGNHEAARAMDKSVGAPRRSGRRSTNMLNEQIKLAQKSLAAMPKEWKALMDQDMKSMFGCSKCGQLHTDEYHPDDELGSPSR